MLGKKIKALAKALGSLDANEAAPRLENGETLTLELDGEPTSITREMVMIAIEAKEGFTVEMENNRFVILDTTLTEELINEGLARELVSKVQQMRKNNGYEVMDQITIQYQGDEAVEKAIELHRGYIQQETLAVEIRKEEGDGFEKQNLNGHETGLYLERVSDF